MCKSAWKGNVQSDPNGLLYILIWLTKQGVDVTPLRTNDFQFMTTNGTSISFPVLAIVVGCQGSIWIIEDILQRQPAAWARTTPDACMMVVIITCFHELLAAKWNSYFDAAMATSNKSFGFFPLFHCQASSMPVSYNHIRMLPKLCPRVLPDRSHSCSFHDGKTVQRHWDLTHDLDNHPLVYLRCTWHLL